jgi:hypothetical protein
MNKQRGYTDIPLPVAAGLIVAILVVLWILANLSCSWRWTDSGFDSRYGVMTGCMVQYKGRWIPEDRYRATDE